MTPAERLKVELDRLDPYRRRSALDVIARLARQSPPLGTMIGGRLNIAPCPRNRGWGSNPCSASSLPA